VGREQGTALGKFRRVGEGRGRARQPDMGCEDEERRRHGSREGVLLARAPWTENMSSSMEWTRGARTAKTARIRAEASPTKRE
jgi:hypothetical protein